MRGAVAQLVERCTGGRRVASSRFTASRVRRAVAQLVECCTGVEGMLVRDSPPSGSVGRALYWGSKGC